MLRRALVRGNTVLRASSTLRHLRQLTSAVSGQFAGCSPHPKSRSVGGSGVQPGVVGALGSTALVKGEQRGGCGQAPLRKFSTATAQPLPEFAFVKVGFGNVVPVLRASC